ncbi:redoxin domain-containing protein [Fluviispira multicolorata]|uniref:Redoxin domain-containing protein n=1 Tax=Fluviispira multicolorata TaxID=2654512 RepID=A0A833N1M3_9BACT|nr:redoxin domain-containing protein [Fluviispira multicolorata]KAB8030950.1 redoxin domain-containing protein [Fluviispira multicolorata]
MPVHAPDLPSQFKWVNSSQQLSLSQYLGHPILLNFWTYCCINCIHMLSDLKKIEEEFCPKGLVVIGVQCAKFSHEKDFESINEACHRLNIQHPVIVDEEMYLWKKYAVRSLPTFVLIDSDGKIIFTASGKNIYEGLKEQISTLIQDKNLPEIKLLEWANIEDKLNLRYPTKAVAAKMNDIINYFISDTFNNRIVHLNSEGKFISSFGEGILASPQGCCVWKNELIVCDSEHHRLLAFDLEGSPQRKYRVLAGKGEKGIFETRSEFVAKLAPINSPADVCVWGNDLAITCAGSHQIVLFVAKDESILHIAGSGREDIVDGPASFAALAQPSGITAISDTILAFTDSETSSIRLIVKNWNESGKTMIVSLVGEGLFDFGFRDGLGAEARMQHPLSCAWSPISQNLYVVDSYNNALRIYSVDKDYLGTVTLSEGLNEPSGIYWFEGKIIISDTNSHRIIILDEDKIDQKDNIDSLEVAQVAEIYSGPFGQISDVPKYMLTHNLV